MRCFGNSMKVKWKHKCFSQLSLSFADAIVTNADPVHVGHCSGDGVS